MYATVLPPSPLAHLADGDVAQETLQEFDEADGIRLFFADLVKTAHHLPTPDSGIESIIDFVADEAGSPAMSPAARATLLLLLLDCVCEQDAHAPHRADWAAMTGKNHVSVPEHEIVLKNEVVARIPALLSRGDLECAATRFVLAALAAF